MGIENLHSIEIEKGLLGYFLNYSEDFEFSRSMLGDNPFWKEEHNLVYSAMGSLLSRSIGIDLLSVLDELTRVKAINKVGGIGFLSDLSNFSARISDLEHNCRVIVDYKIKRELMMLTAKIQKDINEGSDVYDSLSDMNNFNDAVQNKTNTTSHGKEIADLVTKSIDNYFKRQELAESGEIAGIESCVRAVTKHTNGWQGSRLYVIGGRPSMGKTAYALAEAKHMSSNNKHACFFSLEMGSISLSDRLIINQTFSESPNLDHDFSDRFKKGLLTKDEANLMMSAGQELKSMNLYVDDKPSCTIPYIKQACKIRKLKGKCDAIFIDYLQLLTDDDRLGNREQQVARMSRSLKLLAKELDVPVFLLVQLNRTVEQRDNKQPIMSDLRESGAIEQDADMIIFPWRPRYYIDIDSSFEQYVGDAYSSQFPNTDWKKAGLLIFAKDRDNGTDKILVDINKSCTTWKDYSTELHSINPIPEEQAIDFNAGMEDFDDKTF